MCEGRGVHTDAPPLSHGGASSRSAPLGSRGCFKRLDETGVDRALKGSAIEDDGEGADDCRSISEQQCIGEGECGGDADAESGVELPDDP